MSTPLSPSSPSEVADAVRATERIIAVGGGTKPRLSETDAVKLSIANLNGLVEYEPSEYTFTALAGTPVRDIVAALAERGQYIPFDPVLPEAGATLGGTVAAGLNGSGRFRYGGIRDFILAVQFVDGEGRLLRMGGKVVKNAAGFDLPKFFVGSLGRFGVLTEITCKVFPRPASTATLKIPVKDTESAVRVFLEAANTRWEADALDFLPDGKTVCLRLNGPDSALQELSREILARWPGVSFSPDEAKNLWTNLREFRWVNEDGPLFKIVLTPLQIPELDQVLRSLEGALMHVISGGSVAYVSLATVEQAAEFDAQLRKLSLSGVALRGKSRLWCGVHGRTEIAKTVKHALDPQGRFPSLDE